MIGVLVRSLLIPIMFYSTGLLSQETARENPFDVHPVKKILNLDVDSSINPATYSFLKTGYGKAERESYDLVLVKLNTPGGLVSTTKDIITLFGDSEVPTVVWVNPEGASATSAGAIISSAAHFLYMAGGSNIGAATPIASQGQDIESDSKSKAVNDLVALVKSLAQLRGRNQEKFGKMIEEAASYQAQEALELNIIDGVVSTEQELIEDLQGRMTYLKGHQIKIQIEQPSFHTLEMDFGQRLLNIFADPNMAYILFVLGAALLYLEMQVPGTFIAGSIGVICLVLAGIGFQILPLNFGAFGLILVAFVLMVLELYVTSFGLLSISGIICLILGSLFLFRTEDSYIGMSKLLIITTASTIGAFILGLGIYWIRDTKKNKQKDNYYDVAGKQSTIVKVLDSEEEGMFYYQVKISGELWKAKSTDEYQPGQVCVIKNCEGDGLLVEI